MLNRLDKLNAMDLEFCKEFLQCLQEAERREDVRVVVIGGWAHFYRCARCERVYRDIFKRYDLYFKLDLQHGGKVFTLIREFPKPIGGRARGEDQR